MTNVSNDSNMNGNHQSRHENDIKVAMKGISSSTTGSMEEVMKVETMKKLVIDKDGKVKRLRRKKKTSNTNNSTSSLTKRMHLKSSSNNENKLRNNIIIKYGSLALLVAQMMGLVILMRYTRTHTDGELYIASTAVFLMEVMKFLICNAVIFIGAGCTFQGFAASWQKNVVGAPWEVLKLSVPSLLYTVQNNLLYVALTNLDATTYQVTYQLKILTTAIFSVVLLKRKFSVLKWFSLVILAIGVAIVQVSGSGDLHSEKGGENDSKNRLVGFTCVICAACTSGFAGVYFEKILKGGSSSSSPPPTLWVRNIQMGLPSVVAAFITIYVHDRTQVLEKGFFSGYSATVWTVITVQALGGLVVAVVVKYADNVLKVFATSFSIIGSCIISSIFFDFHPNLHFTVGTSLVVISTIIYSRPEPRKKKRIGSSNKTKLILPR